MVGERDDGEIEIPLDDTVAGGAGDDTVQGGSAQELSPDEALAKLKADLDAANADRAALAQRASTAEAEARRHATDAANAKGEAQDDRVQLVTTAIENVKQAGDAMELALADAYAAQDFAEVAKIQRAMSANAAKQQTLENGLEQLKAQPKPKAAETADDPVEKLARGMQSDFPQSAAWVRAHPDWVRDGARWKKVLAASNYATDVLGLKPDTPEYFVSVEQSIGLRQQRAGNGHDTDDDALSEAAAPAQRRQSPPSAPVSRGSNGEGSTAARTIRLSRDEVEIAHSNYPDMKPADAERAYAKAKSDLQREGRLH